MLTSARHNPAGTAAGKSQAQTPQLIRRLFHGPSRSLIWFGVVLIAASLIVSAVAFWQYRQAMIERSQADLRRLAVSLSQQTLAAVKSVDMALQSVRNDYVSRPINGEVEHHTLRSIVAALPQLQNMFITDANGISIHSARSYPAPRASMADNPAFKAHQSGVDGLVITPTLRARIDGRWALLVSRPITDAEGHFQGMVAADVDPLYLSHLYSGIDLGQRGAISLISRDDMLLSRHPWVEERIGRKIMSPSLDAALKQAEIGVYRARSGYDNKDRLYGYAAIDEFGLVVLALIDTNIILAEWWHHVLIVGGWVIAADVIIALLIAGLVLQMRRREQSELRFRDFADAASDWYWETDSDLAVTYVSRVGREPADFPVQEAFGRSLRELLVLPAEDHTSRQFEADVSARRHFREFMCQLRTVSGRVWHFKLSGMPRFDGTGQFAGYRGVAQDITPVVRERSATARANMRFLYAIENGSDAFAFWDADDRFVMCNENYRQRAGRAAKFLTPGIPFERFCWESIRLGDIDTEPGKAADTQELRVGFHKAATGERTVVERSGLRFYLRVLRTPDGGRLAISSVVQERKSGQSAA